MRGNRSDQQQRGHWLKDKSERGIYQRGKMWYIRYRDQNGKPHAERVGPSKALALKVIEKRRTEVAERRFFPATGIPFEEIVDDAIMLARESFKSKHPDKKFKPGNYEIIKKWFAGRAADAITPSEIAAKLSEHTDVPATFNRFRVAISHAYKIAVENKKVRENIGRLVKMQKENNERVRYLNQFVPEKGQKDEETRLREAIRKLYPDPKWEHRGCWEEIVSVAKLQDFHWHDLRHTFASRLVMKGVDIFTVCRLMRHKNIQTTMRYAHLANKHLEDAVAKLVPSPGVTGSDTATEVAARPTTYLQ